MAKRFFGLTLTALLFALSYSASAPQPKRVPLIGYLSGSNLAAESAQAEAIRQALRELGYIEGQSIATEYRYAEGKTDQGSELAAELCVSRLISSWYREGAGLSGRP
jgi:putative ABC transport system substrate-binding protein